MTVSDHQTEPQKFESVRGFRDILPEEYDYYTLLKKTVRHRLRQSGFRRIETPFLEPKNLFAHAIGGDTSLCKDELFSFSAREGALSLIPEATTSICRAYVEHDMDQLAQPVQMYSIEPHFRNGSLRGGNLRQFHQISIECMGVRDPSIDASLMHLVYSILQDLKIAHHFKIQLNTLGSVSVRKEYSDALKNYFYGKERHLSPESLEKLETSPMEILHSKDEDDQILVSLAPKLADFLDDDARIYTQKIKEFLEELEVPFEENPQLIPSRGYYSDVIFQFWDKNQGAKNAIASGGRYDGLIEQLGGSSVPGCGVALAMERIIAHMKEENILPPEKDKTHVFVAQLGEQSKKKAVKILAELHERGVHARGAMGKPSMKDQLKMAEDFRVDWAILMGEVEVRDKTAILRNMRKGTQELISYDEVVEKVIEKVGKENLDVYHLGE